MKHPRAFTSVSTVRERTPVTLFAGTLQTRFDIVRHAPSYGC